MTNAGRVLSEIKIECSAKKGEYEWLDEVIDSIILIAHNLIMNLPSDDILDKVMVSFTCEDHHDGYIHELYLYYDNPRYNGLSLIISDGIIGITNDDAEVIGEWDVYSDKSIKAIAPLVYTKLKKLLLTQ